MSTSVTVSDRGEVLYQKCSSGYVEEPTYSEVHTEFHQNNNIPDMAVKEYCKGTRHVNISDMADIEPHKNTNGNTEVHPVSLQANNKNDLAVSSITEQQHPRTSISDQIVLPRISDMGRR